MPSYVPFEHLVFSTFLEAAKAPGPPGGETDQEKRARFKKSAGHDVYNAMRAIMADYKMHTEHIGTQLPPPTARCLWLPRKQQHPRLHDSMWSEKSGLQVRYLESVTSSSPSPPGEEKPPLCSVCKKWCELGYLICDCDEVSLPRISWFGRGCRKRHACNQNMRACAHVHRMSAASTTFPSSRVPKRARCGANQLHRFRGDRRE